MEEYSTQQLAFLAAKAHLATVEAQPVTGDDDSAWVVAYDSFADARHELIAWAWAALNSSPAWGRAASDDRRLVLAMMERAINGTLPKPHLDRLAEIACRLNPAGVNHV